MLSSVREIRGEPSQYLISNAVGLVQATKEDLMVDSVEGGGQVKQGQDRYVSCYVIVPKFVLVQPSLQK